MDKHPSQEVGCAKQVKEVGNNGLFFVVFQVAGPSTRKGKTWGGECPGGGGAKGEGVYL